VQISNEKEKMKKLSISGNHWTNMRLC